MAHSGHQQGSRSPNPCRKRGDCRRPERGKSFPQGVAEDEDWETDPDYVHEAGRHGLQWAEHEISTASIISDLSRSIRDCSLGKRNPHSRKEGAGRQSHPQGCTEAVRTSLEGPEGQRVPLCPQVRSSPNLGIERSSVFHRNVAEALDSFFAEKLKAWAGDTAQQSDCGEDMGALQEEPTDHCRPHRGAKKVHAATGPVSRRRNHHRGPQAKGAGAEHVCTSRENSDPGSCGGQWPRTDLVGKGKAPTGLPWRHKGSRPSTSVASSARILPQCRITHVQSCRACQAFNQDLPAGQEALDQNAWVHVQDERRGDPRRKGRAGSSSQRQLPDRLSKVQQWLEQTPVEQPPDCTRLQMQEESCLASPKTPSWAPVSRSLDPKEGDPWGKDGNLDPPAEARRSRKTPRGGNPNHQPVARVFACDDTSTSPAMCSCLFCEQQRPRAQPAAGRRAGRKGADPSAEEVAAQLQAEKRVSRIVEAFERRSLREAKLAERERASQSARQRELEKRARARHGQPPPQSSAKARKAHATEEQRQEEPRPGGLAPEGHHKHSRRKERAPARKQPSFMDRIRWLC